MSLYPAVTNQLEVQWPAYGQIELKLVEVRCQVFALTQNRNGLMAQLGEGRWATWQECCAFVTEQACTVVPCFKQPLTVSQTHTFHTCATSTSRNYKHLAHTARRCAGVCLCRRKTCLTEMHRNAACGAM